ncbi:Oidioi.mRNA.OKI2018_I69.chr1.g2443.t1.cds [Oikopleura dioica]|uniref:Oidioi.mRNA.OKI2018_I69.chr1.g2443.t1.cds n=1 Tax=Oikopleura dioica TaxID=34765 RepID=A0ABN7SY13_OIKDI|nr:Oidioi.mRNA.OKI2018_I69.chr1.g2443.t1.cds [Oikopleura dioica]
MKHNYQSVSKIAVMGNVAGSIAIFFYGYISWCVAAHLYWMSWVANWNKTAFWASLIAVLICEWIFLTLIMALSFFQANFIGCTCCCRDPSEVGAIEPAGEMIGTQNFQQYPAPGQVYPVAIEPSVPLGQPNPTQVYPTTQEEYPPAAQPNYDQSAQAPYGHYEANAAPQQVNESSFQ